ncbi:MAG: hypothetical protein ACK521_04835, partial [bacterium]
IYSLKMFDFVCIFTTGGVLLCNKALYADCFNVELINIFIKSVLLDDGARIQTRRQFIHQDYMLKWQVANDLKLVFLVVYKEILQLAYVEQFLELLAKAFVGSVYQQLVKKGDVFHSLSLPATSENHGDLF